MLRQALLQKNMWFFDGKSFVREIICTGNTVCVCPGNAALWHKDIETIFKEKAYTSELYLDWNYKYIIHRDGYRIKRGIKIYVDEWLFRNLWARR